MRTSCALAVMLVACGPVPTEADAGDVSIDGGASLPTTRAQLKAFLLAETWKSWAAEPAVHNSAGPHGGLVRTFVNPALYDSLKQGSATHPAGSIVVKELHSATEVTGYAIDVKREDGEWVFLEGFKPSIDQYYFTGTNNLCGTCHAGGRDFVLTPASAFP